MKKSKNMSRISKGYIKTIINISKRYLQEIFSITELKKFIKRIDYLNKEKNTCVVIDGFINNYINFVKENYQNKYHRADKKLNTFIKSKRSIKLIWGDAYSVLKAMDSESIHLMVTSPPYYNARDYSTWVNLNDYLKDMKNIVEEAYRVLDNHRVFVFNVGDIFDNDNLKTRSVWGKGRLPLGAYFIKIFEDCGFTFVDDFIWDKGQVQSERHKHDNTPYPFYQYPMNCYEHILIFHKHRLDKTRYPCPVCGTLKVNGNTQSEPGIQSWECKNEKCFERSKCNRGKRFSLKTLMTQSHHEKEQEIPLDFIRKWRRDIVRFSPVIKINCKGQNIIGHTAPFPEEIPEMAIRYYTYRNENVLDPFAGSFTTPIVAYKLGRKGIGIEINKDRFRESIINNIRNKLGNSIKKSEIDYL
ncbi:MAG: site-specific DNA-methyltransferase [Elusimicrobiota bacterium]|nr:site-specific DNA-methyltransferase [Elusimicrobiota bacterium]